MAILGSPLLALAAAVAAGLLVMTVAARVNIQPANAPARALSAYHSDALDTPLEWVGAWVMRRVPRLRHLLGIELYRRWVLLEGRTWTIPAAVGLATLLTVAGLGLMMLTGQPALVILPILGFLYPFVRMRSRALKLQAQVQSTLPDLAALLAAEMTASNPPDKALERCAEFEGPLSRIIQIAVQEARVTGRPLFGKSSDVAGVLLEVAARYELPALRAFTAQVDMAARTGGNGAALMTGLARTLITEYKDRALREAEALDSRLAVPSVGFFFMPFLFLILVPLLLPVLNAL